MASPASTPSRTLPDSAGEPGSSAHSSVKPSGEALAITVQDDFLLELGEALGGQIAVRPVDSLATALEHLSGSRRAQILLIDSRDTADLRGDVERARTQAPHLPLVVFAPADSEKTVAGGLKSSNVFAVLPIPVDPRKTAAILEGALADAVAKRNAPRGAERAADARAASRAPIVPERQPEPPAALETSDEEPPSRKRLVVTAIAAVLVAGAAAVGLYVHNKTHSAAVAGAHMPGASAAGAVGAGAPAAAAARAGAAGPSVAGTGAAAAGVAPGAAEQGSEAGVAAGVATVVVRAQPVAAAHEAAQVPLVAGTLDELLEKARLAMRERRYTEPASNCALLYYRSALKVDPTNGEARDGMGRLANVLMSRFDDAMTAGHYDEAASAIADLKIAAPGDIRLSTLEGRLLQAEVNGAFSDGDVDRATALVRQAQQSGAVSSAQLAKWRAELSRDQSEARVARLTGLLNTRIREGRLLDPSNDSAKYYLQQLRQLAPDDPAAERGTRDLVAAYLLAARNAAVAGNSAQADKWVAEARAAGMTAAELSAYQLGVAAAREKAATAAADHLAQLARDRMQNGALTTPDNDSALYYLTQLKSTYGDSSTVHSIGLELASSLLERATASARAGKVAQMSADLAVARRWGADPVLVQAVEEIVTAAAKPAAQSAGSGSGAIAHYVPKRIRYTAPEFPEAALDAHISGSVIVEFTVDLDGRPRDVRVVKSTPRGVFDYAATTAVSRWRFEAPPAAIPTRMIIRFDAPKD